MNRLALGTAQFGLNYGIANRQGPPRLAEVGRILAVAQSVGLDTLDTAIAYGDCEAILGKNGMHHFRVISKLPAIPNGKTAVTKWINETIHGSLERLRLTHLYGVLLHRPQELLGANGSEIWDCLNQLKKDGIVTKIGISVYGPDDLENICRTFSTDLVQIPFNIFDRRLPESGWLKRLRENGTEIHVRSIFLQGLLLMAPAKRPAYFQHWQPLWNKWDSWLADFGVSPLAACLRFALSEAAVDKIIVGVDSLHQLEQILEACSDPAVPPIPPEIRSDDPNLINPSMWKLN